MLNYQRVIVQDYRIILQDYGTIQFPLFFVQLIDSVSLSFVEFCTVFRVLWSPLGQSNLWFLAQFQSP